MHEYEHTFTIIQQWIKTLFHRGYFQYAVKYAAIVTVGGVFVGTIEWWEAFFAFPCMTICFSICLALATGGNIPDNIYWGNKEKQSKE